MDDIPALSRRIASLPLAARRHALRAVWTAGRIAGRKADFDLHGLLRHTLRLGTRDAKRLDREIAFHDTLTELEWLALLVRSTDQLIADSRRVVTEGAGILTRTAASGNPVILAPLHMGNYVFGLAATMRTFFPGRRMLILRAREDHEADTRVMERIREIGIEMRFLQVSDKASYAEAVRFVRQGAVVIYFVDLPPSYGGPIDVELLGRPMRLALGIDSLARVANATVVPLAVTSSLSGDTVHVGRAFEVVDVGRAERLRIAGLVSRHVETAILRAPGQWHFWPRLSEFAPLPDLATDAAE
ncbi:hypothetical protein ASG40_07410 [Methylobacterium sp. Leaf399]|uniref:LpxL/LpxP family acyltransferase n=1 Tax=unclassified Methylobacterium TaxID=2615210 RepID=UPI0006F40D0E|nr:MULTISPECIES: hypothetical protein [unclassified Methylobacterium]KQP52656.1 hypothetical protein ASF39_07030 [Methylobacterium sp. Leaf108]KQT11835.1 hypothetical protein ASG40_07410 [Methylobacterium sp. Leaf399]KQT84367.1 hypothetical protein ASG59_03005 [Methylobacterium sp. Leaf466]